MGWKSVEVTEVQRDNEYWPGSTGVIWCHGLSKRRGACNRVIYRESEVPHELPVQN